MSAFYLWPYVWRLTRCSYFATSTASCNYLYAVGAFGLLFSILIGVLQWAAVKSGGMGTHACNVVVNFMHLGWWIAAGVYFTAEYNDLPKPADFGLYVDTGIPYDYMRAINALCFTAVAFAALSLIASFVALAAPKEIAAEKHSAAGPHVQPDRRDVPHVPTPGAWIP